MRDLDYVLWELGVSVVRQLLHVKLRASGAWTLEFITDDSPTAATAARLQARARRPVQM